MNGNPSFLINRDNVDEVLSYIKLGVKKTYKEFKKQVRKISIQKQQSRTQSNDIMRDHGQLRQILVMKNQEHEELRDLVMKYESRI